MTIASTLPEMLAGITGVGDDLRFFSSVGTPSVLIGEMTLAGVCRIRRTCAKGRSQGRVGGAASSWSVGRLTNHSVNSLHRPCSSNVMMKTLS